MTNPMRKRLTVLLATLFLLSAICFGQGVAVTAHLVNGQGQNITTAYLHFELWNCGKNVPQVIGQPPTIVPNQFDMHANPTTEIIRGISTGITKFSAVVSNPRNGSLPSTKA